MASICIRSNRESCGWTHSDLKMLAAETIKGLLSFASSYSEACADSRRKAGLFPASSSLFRTALDRAFKVHNLCVSRVRWTQNGHISRFSRPFNVAVGQVFSRRLGYLFGLEFVDRRIAQCFCEKPNVSCETGVIESRLKQS